MPDVTNSHLRYPLPRVTMSEDEEDEEAVEAVGADPRSGGSVEMGMTA